MSLRMPRRSHSSGTLTEKIQKLNSESPQSNTVDAPGNCRETPTHELRPSPHPLSSVSTVLQLVEAVKEEHCCRLGFLSRCSGSVLSVPRDLATKYLA
jgi:hypothetical protein